MDYHFTRPLIIWSFKNIAFVVISQIVIGQFGRSNFISTNRNDNFTKESRNYLPYSSRILSTINSEEAKLLCYNKTDGIYRHSQLINIYYMCKDGLYTEQHCSEGLAFNTLSLNCELNISEKSKFSNNLCEFHQDGFIPDYFSTNCQHFFRCERGAIIERRYCENGMKFSYVDQRCELENEVPCIQTKCTGSADGYFIIPGSQCRGYYSCINGIKRDFICPEGMIFDRISQTCTGYGGVCYELICAGRINGYYPDTTHGCQRYYNCEGGYVKSVNVCPRGYLFNGSSCVNSTLVFCSPVQNTAISLLIQSTDVCAGLQDGANSISDNYCQSYVLCKSGITIAVLKCPDGQHFDGHKCINVDLFPCTSICVGKTNGYHANARKGCQEYVNCIDGRIAEIQKCLPGTIFNGENCVEVSYYNCPTGNIQEVINTNKCSNLKDGYHTDYLSGCKEYFNCFKGKILAHNYCFDDTVWNGEECVKKDYYVCEGPTISAECSIKGNGVFTDFSSSSRCTKYFYCNNGKKVRLSCPINQVFDGSNCVPSEFFKCPSVEIDCINKSQGYHIDVYSGCQLYYYCSNGNKITYVCANGYVFNGNKCVSKQNYECPGNLSDACKNLINGYYPDPDSSCKNYFYCLNNQKVMSFTCPNNEIFDGFKCVTNANKCQTRLKISCDLLKDDVYIKANTDCREYFQCFNRKVSSLSFCENGLIFNGNTCVRPSFGQCDNLMKNQVNKIVSCDKINNGFFVDLTSGCRSYFFCINGIKTDLSCPQGKVFNGELCINAINFQCPQDLVIPQTVI